MLNKTEKIQFKWPSWVEREVSSHLEEQIKRDQLASSYIFYGPGRKYQTALSFANLLLCLGSIRPCQGRCCQTFKHSSHPDFVIVKRGREEKSISIEAVRQLIRRVSFKVEYRRAVIIRQAEFLGVEAANALLKTLEEPASNTIFILTTNNIGLVLPTIISRSQKIYLSLNSPVYKNSGRDKRTTEFLKGDLIVRFKIARDIKEERQAAVKLLLDLERHLRRELLRESRLKPKKSLASNLSKISASLTLLSRSISVRIILENLALNWKNWK